jgi:hypothetical protein
MKSFEIKKKGKGNSGKHLCGKGSNQESFLATTEREEKKLTSSEQHQNVTQ